MPGSVSYCRNGCGVQIKFDPYRKSQSGKMIPLEATSGEPHQCPKSQYALKQQQQAKTPIEYDHHGEAVQLQRETKANIDYRDVHDNNSSSSSDNLVILELVQSQTVSLQHIEHLLQDIKDLILSSLHPNPETSTAKDLLTQNYDSDSMGMSDIEEEENEEKTANE